MNDLRVLIVANDPLARAALAASLEGQADVEVVGQLSEAEDVVDQLNLFEPEVAVWDLGWNPASDLEAGLENLSELVDTGLPTVALLADESLAPEVWATGISGLLLRDTPAESLSATLATISYGLSVFDPSLASRLAPLPEPDAEILVEPLTPRENEVLQLLADGLSNRAIAHELGISEHTVKFHVNSLLGKLGAQSRTEAVVRATRLGLVIL